MTSDLETEIDQIRKQYPEHSINIQWNNDHGYWALAVSKTGQYDADGIVAFGGSRASLLEAVRAVEPVDQKRKRKRR